MSRLFAKYKFNPTETEIIDVNGIEFDPNRSFSMRFLKTNDVFEFPDFNIKIPEVDLRRMIAIDNYSEDEKNELYYHELLTTVEQKDLDDDTFYIVSLLQWFFHISTHTLTLAKRQAHLRRLNKTDSKSIKLKHRQFHSNGGRPFGAITNLTETDLQNIENADAIIENCIKHNWFNEFMELHKLLIRVHKCDLSIAGVKWKYRILRSKAGYGNYDLKVLEEMNKKYGILR